MRDLDDNTQQMQMFISTGHFGHRGSRNSPTWYGTRIPPGQFLVRHICTYKNVVSAGRPPSLLAGKSPEGVYPNLCAKQQLFPSHTMLRGSHVQIWVNSGCSSLEVRHKLLSGILENALVTVTDDICYPSC